MEIGTVKFFCTNPDKMFGFIVDSDYREVFFHFNDGRTPVLHEVHSTKSVDLVLPKSPLRIPRAGDRVAFERGRNAQGPKARPWCYNSEYENALDQTKSNLTLEHAKKILTNLSACVLEYEQTYKAMYAVQITTVTKITWCDADDRIVATGQFSVMKERSGATEHELAVKETAVVDVHSPDPSKYHRTQFQLSEANALKGLGRTRQVTSGVYKSVMWNGGSDYYVIDPASIRIMTDEEISKVNWDFPDLNGWLLCKFARDYGTDHQVVKILAHLGSHD